MEVVPRAAPLRLTTCLFDLCAAVQTSVRDDEDCVGRDAPRGLMEGDSPPSTGGEAARTCAGQRGGRVASPSISEQATRAEEAVIGHLLQRAWWEVEPNRRAEAA